MTGEWDAVVAGGGAAGFFGAIACAELGLKRVLLLEATAHVLAKVRISGGGRCNVTHACFEPRTLAAHYPRGGRELLGPFHRWQPRDTVEWFESRGVALKTEPDGRMFPVTDRSETIVECLKHQAAKAGVKVHLQAGLRAAEKLPGGGFRLSVLTAGEAEPGILTCRSLLLATGGTRGSAGFAIAEALGHAIEPLVPSLFTFHIDDPRLKGLEGLSVPAARLTVEAASRRSPGPAGGGTRLTVEAATRRLPTRESGGTPPPRGIRLESEGPLLVTHTGLSGPAVLKLSAWGAREFAACQYRFKLSVNWSGERGRGEVRAALESARTGEHRRQRVANWNPIPLPSRLWERLAAAAGAAEGQVWADAPKALIEALAHQAAETEFAVEGKSLNKEEFVTCGGVRLSEVDFRTLESKRCPGLHFAGEVLDIDGLTGGFNFQAAWTTARLAAEAMAAG